MTDEAIQIQYLWVIIQKVKVGARAGCVRQLNVAVALVCLHSVAS